MVYVSIFSDAEIQALEAHPADDMIVIKLEAIESVDSSREAYPRVLRLVKQRIWPCAKIDPFSRVAAMALELNRIQHDLLVRLQGDGNGADVSALLLLKNAAMTVSRLSNASPVKGNPLLAGRAQEFADTVLSAVNEVLKGVHDGPWFQGRIPHLLNLLIAVSLTSVNF